MAQTWKGNGKIEHKLEKLSSAFFKKKDKAHFECSVFYHYDLDYWKIHAKAQIRKKDNYFYGTGYWICDIDSISFSVCSNKPANGECCVSVIQPNRSNRKFSVAKVLLEMCIAKEFHVLNGILLLRPTFITEHMYD